MGIVLQDHLNGTKNPASIEGQPGLYIKLTAVSILTISCDEEGQGKVNIPFFPLAVADGRKN